MKSKTGQELADEMADAVLNTAALVIALGLVWAAFYGGRK